ncbi:MAG TPA: DUF3303 family protein [Solirubrobacterales bacterium]
MRFAIIYRPKFQVPQDKLPELLKGTGEWLQSHGDRVEGVQFFLGGGGFGTIETDDVGELMRLLADHPFTQYSDVEIKPIVDPQAAMSVLQEVYS